MQRFIIVKKELDFSFAYLTSSFIMKLFEILMAICLFKLSII